MRCPFCNHNDTQVRDSRSSDDGSSIRRRRICPACEARFTTYERLHLRELIVLKKDGKKRSFDRYKLARSINLAVHKRPIQPDQIEALIAHITAKLEGSGESEIPSSKIGEMVMEELAKLDKVAYVRFASVYREFREVQDFERFIDTMDETTTH